MQLAANNVQLVSGGNVIKQGDETPFTFQLNDESGQPVDLTGATVNIRLANSQIVVLEKQATINDDNTVTFNISSDETTGHGNMRLEFVVTYPDETTGIFPAQGYQEITITPSLGGLDSGYVAVITIEEFERRINEAVDKANNAADNATQAIEDVDDVIQSANTATQFANEAGTYANEQGDYAKTQGDYAKQQGDTAKDEASNLSQLKDDVTTATTNANQSAINADNAATNANEQATFANTQGNYAKEQGDYAKAQGDAIQDIFDEGLVASVNGQTGAVVLDADDVGAYSKEEVDTKIDSIPDPTWDNLQNKPSQFPPISHSHSISEINGLQTELSSKATTQKVEQVESELNAHKADDAPHKYGNRFEWRYNATTDSLDLVVIE